jgi:hypothetical protein
VSSAIARAFCQAAVVSGTEPRVYHSAPPNAVRSRSLSCVPWLSIGSRLDSAGLVGPTIAAGLIETFGFDGMLAALVFTAIGNAFLSVILFALLRLKTTPSRQIDSGV